jgi:ketosteroid isomerase-like protein
MRGLSLGASALLLVACVKAPDGDGASSAAETQRVLVAQADAWDKAIVRKDRAAIEENVAPGFFHIGGDGSTSDRASFIADLLDPELTIAPYTVEELTVRLPGPDTALLSGTTHMTGTYKGVPFQSYYRYIDTYVRRDGRWRVVAVQITKLAPPKAP